ncbi:MAG: hypothetical protein IPF72_03070 [Chitinophagaceae bacterium]|nr:hypothetical protein [Chitinophagaceae bacterium]
MYLYDPAKGFTFLIIMAALKNRLAFLNWTNVEVNGTTVYGFEETKLYSYQLKSLQLKEYKLPAFFGKYISIKAMNGLVYLLNEKGVDIYQIR